MREPVYRLLGLPCVSVAGLPMRTNPTLVCVLWILVRGRLLPTARVSRK